MDVATLATAPAVTCQPTTAIIQVARLMAEQEVGSVIVIDDDGRLAGIVTDRDIALRGYARRLDPGAAVSTIMSNDVVGVPEHAGWEAAANQLAAWVHRRLPVVDDDGVVRGVITLDDLLLHCTSILERMTTAVRSEVRPGRQGISDHEHHVANGPHSGP
jgi:CBS domain-containing protein